MIAPERALLALNSTRFIQKYSNRRIFECAQNMKYSDFRYDRQRIKYANIDSYDGKLKLCAKTSQQNEFLYNFHSNNISRRTKKKRDESLYLYEEING